MTLTIAMPAALDAEAGHLSRQAANLYETAVKYWSAIEAHDWDQARELANRIADECRLARIDLGAGS
jgi:hypothetical protein